MKPFVIQFVRSERGLAPIPLRIELPYGQAIFIGRLPNSHILINDGTVGKPHAMLVSMPSQLSVLIVAFDTPNGTWVNGACKPIQYLKLNQEFRIARDFWFRVTE